MEHTTYSYVREKLFKINGEYIKFYVTTNDKLHKLLANSGAAIIYHENGTNLNYIYVAGELIASGYGFKNTNLRDTLEWWATSYEDELKKLNDKDKELEDLIGQVNDDITEVSNKSYVRINKGELKDTKLTHVNKNMTIKAENIIDLIYDDTTYEKYKLLDILIRIDYSVSSVEESAIFKHTDPIMLPVGALLKKVEILIPIELNDNGRPNSISLKYVKNNSNEELLETNTIELGNVKDDQSFPIDDIIDSIQNAENYNDIFDMFIDDTIQGNVNYFEKIENEHHDDNDYVTDVMLRFNITFGTETERDKHYFQVRSGANILANLFDIVLSATPSNKYKYYPFSMDEWYLEEHENDDTEYLGIPISQNIIPEQEIKFGNEDLKEYFLTIEGVEPVYILEHDNTINNQEGLILWKKAQFTEGTVGYVQHYAKKYPGLIVPFDNNIAMTFFPKEVGTKNELVGNTIQSFSTVKTDGFNIKDATDILKFSSTIQYVFNNYSFNINVMKKSHTIMFMTPKRYVVKKIYYTNSQNDIVDLTGYFIYCGSEKIDSPVELSNIKGNTLILNNDIRLYYAFSLNGFPKEFTLTVELQNEEDNDIFNDKLHLDVSNGAQLLHQVDFDTEHWYNADLSIMLTKESAEIEDNAQTILYHNVESLNTLKTYLEKVSEYL